MLQAVRFSPSPRLAPSAPSASSTPSVTQAKNVQRQGLSPGYLKAVSEEFLEVKERGATADLDLLSITAQVAEYYASLLRNIESTKSKEEIRSFTEKFISFSRIPGLSEDQKASWTSYFDVDGIPTTQEEATPLAEKFSTLAADIMDHIESIKAKA
ncbi:MAG: hypothetical protein ACK551_00425 [Vampirovibrionales bacterium]